MVLEAINMNDTLVVGVDTVLDSVKLTRLACLVSSTQHNYGQSICFGQTGRKELIST